MRADTSTWHLWNVWVADRMYPDRPPVKVTVAASSDREAYRLVMEDKCIHVCVDRIEVA